MPEIVRFEVNGHFFPDVILIRRQIFERSSPKHSSQRAYCNSFLSPSRPTGHYYFRLVDDLSGAIKRKLDLNVDIFHISNIGWWEPIRDDAVANFFTGGLLSTIRAGGMCRLCVHGASQHQPQGSKQAHAETGTVICRKPHSPHHIPRSAALKLTTTSCQSSYLSTGRTFR